jgi:outer membrane protein
MNGRSTLLALAVVVGATAVAGAAADAVAQATPPARIAILDVQKVIRESLVAADIRSQVSRQEKVYQSELAGEEQEVRAASEELARQRAILSSDVFAQKRKELNSRVAALQRGVASRKRELDRARIASFKEVERSLSDIISEIAKERGLNLILSRVNTRSVVLYADDALNITAEVVKRLDQRLPSVKVPLAQD